MFADARARGALYFVDNFLALNNKTTTFCCCSLFCLLFLWAQIANLRYPLTRIITAHPSDRGCCDSFKVSSCAERSTAVKAINAANTSLKFIVFDFINVMI